MENEGDFHTLVKESVFGETTFLRLAFSGPKGPDSPWIKVVLRPVQIRGQRHIQVTHFDGVKNEVKNLRGQALLEKVNGLLEAPFRQLHLQTTVGDLHVRITKKNRALVRKAKPSRPAVRPDLVHNRQKKHLLPENTPDVYLQALGMMDASGRIKAAMQDKFRQVNHFLSLFQQTFPPSQSTGETLHILDCGCGNAYLTFAAYHFLHHLHHLPVQVVGVDANPERVQHCESLRGELGWQGLEFVTSRILDFTPEIRPDIVMSLHACDTATDEAITQGVAWNTPVILAAPCCQHELRPRIKAPLFAPVLRHGILKQRLAETLTDAFRAQVLRILGYKTDVVEFIDSRHTPKNIMIRARKETETSDQSWVSDYLDLRDFWQVEPAVERLLKGRLDPLFARAKSGG